MLDGSRHDVVDEAFLRDQFDHATRLYERFGLTFTRGPTRALSDRFARIETYADRDALENELHPHAINVFLVRSLRDLDNSTLERRGVTWRGSHSRSVKYIIVASNAAPTSMAHEIGHFLGLGHTKVKDNLMSYDRTAGHISLNDRQGQAVRRYAEHLRVLGLI